ncbi:STAS domain-containing protein [Streptomyces sp. Q6]|uniref:STAS domain-containing protein n=1 Tax=Streptomyces citrinus TaxID=3118173 RepID=A0ACD5A4J8_9ACTN
MTTPSSPTPFLIRIVDVDGAVLVRVRGELDLATAPHLEQALDPLRERPCELDLAEVGFADSTGVNLLLRLQRRAAAAGGSIRVLAVSGPVRRILDLSGVTSVLLPHLGRSDPPSPGER